MKLPIKTITTNMSHQGKYAARQGTLIFIKPAAKKIKKFLSNRSSQRGQSFVELTLVVIFLMIFVAGIVEFGFLLNDYLNLVDASRESVRYSANFDPFLPNCPDPPDAGCLDDNFFDDTFRLTEEVLAPVTLDSTRGDDIVISFFSVADGYYRRFPDNQGRSRYLNQVSELSNEAIQNRLDNSAPPTGVLLVEIFYNYPQVLKLPVFTTFLQDPMPLHSYSIMPLTAAEPFITAAAGGGGGGGGGGEPPSPTATLIPSNTPVPTDTSVDTPTQTMIPTNPSTPTNTVSPTASFTPTATATASNTPTATATTFVCNVSGSSLFLESKKTLALDITNNSGQTLHYANLMLFFNNWSPSNQELQRVTNNGTILWSGNVTSSPASGSIGGELPPGSTRLEFRFRKNYSVNGGERLIVEFSENGCPVLDIP